MMSTNVHGKQSTKRLPDIVVERTGTELPDDYITDQAITTNEQGCGNCQGARPLAGSPVFSQSSSSVSDLMGIRTVTVSP